MLPYEVGFLSLRSICRIYYERVNHDYDGIIDPTGDVKIAHATYGNETPPAYSLRAC